MKSLLLQALTGLFRCVINLAEQHHHAIIFSHIIPVHAVISRREAEAGQVMLQGAVGKRMGALDEAVRGLAAWR